MKNETRAQTRTRVRTSPVDPVFAHWVETMGKKAPLLTADRLAALKARRREGFTDAQLCAAIDGCKLSPWHMGSNDRGTAFNDLTTILKSGKSVDMHMETLAQGGPKPRHDARGGFGDSPPRSEFPQRNDAECKAELDEILPKPGGAL